MKAYGSIFITQNGELDWLAKGEANQPLRSTVDGLEWYDGPSETIEVLTDASTFREIEITKGLVTNIGEEQAATAQAGIQFYKVISDYSLDDDTVTANPCDYDGGNVDTETTVTCYIESPWANSTNMPKRDVKIKQNDVIAGLPFGVNKAMLLPLPPRVPEDDNAYVQIATVTQSGAKTSFNWIPAGDKYQVLQVKSRKPDDATDSIGFDYLRFTD